MNTGRPIERNGAAMPDRSPELNAAVRAVRGESDLDAVLPALDEDDLARAVACAPETHHLVRAVAALCGGLPSLLDPPTRAGPALHAALVRLIGTPAGRATLRSWAEIAPAGWGVAHAAALRDAVRQGMCDSCVAAALIGPDDRLASLLRSSADIAFAIRRWGQSDSAAPTAWATALAPAERDRLIATVRRDSFSAVASCLPWLPPDVARAASETCSVNIALEAFADASPTARALHAAILQRLVDRAEPDHLGALTRLACAMRDDDIWRRMQTLVRDSPFDVWRVVAAAPWDDLAKDVRAAILECADHSPVMAAVAAARGRRDATTAAITGWAAVAFFAALAPAVWDALDPATQQRWRHTLDPGHAHLAIRTLGLRPEVLSRATLDDDLVRDMHRHARGDAATLHQALFPITLRAVDPDAAHALITAMPTPPPDPGAFFVIAGGRDDPDVLALARSALRTPGDLACAVALQRGARGDERARPACAALQHALRGRSWDDLAPILTLLTDDDRTVLMPRSAIFTRRLARPDRRAALRQALDRPRSRCIGGRRGGRMHPTLRTRWRTRCTPTAACSWRWRTRRRTSICGRRCCRCRRTPRWRTRCAPWRTTTCRPPAVWRAHATTGTGGRRPGSRWRCRRITAPG